ncbi:cobalt-precorrin-5B (C(1))-methyltransferase CbiD [Desulfurivibrio dismutans]|uniref:cobalt-precorrin-5B (C(1))-methyltransferase CbiD n=1 Tax=Desulfurivibrio dismutans TaxID=1398908 RepID=UPI0023D99A08|nr:cobalt-precorrin-5B (C(1))-methyltransferase CbiD [Desulfurivibrio alkaliphilus]MDF1613353.1 cobalt-precorrin-5B (C(1))-methyltransferase CbiD [Desulfurivibrio alkaliphilus]
MARRLRSGYTTGACAAAAAKAAVLFAGRGTAPERVEIPFPDGSRHGFAVHRSWQQPGPGEGNLGTLGSENLGSDTNFATNFVKEEKETPGGDRLRPAGAEQGKIFVASVIKDAGDDPDVTNGAEIVAMATPEATFQSMADCRHDCVELDDGQATSAADYAPAQEPAQSPQDAGPEENHMNQPEVSGHGVPQVAASGTAMRAPAREPARSPQDAVPRDRLRIVLCRGDGVGWVSKPGLAIAPGEPAINPVPRQMIGAAVREALADITAGGDSGFRPAALRLTIAIPGGEALANKTLNHRLGIIGGLSILGTTGIVRPVSAAAWTATIAASLDVARAAGLKEVVLATGRTSEKGVQRLLALPDEAHAMMGDYLHFSLTEAGKRGFRHLHLAGMWAKIVKAALKIPQTHVRHGALEVRQAVELLVELGASPALAAELAEANTAREILVRLQAAGAEALIDGVCRRAAEYATQTAGIPVTVYLVDGHMKILTRVEAGQHQGSIEPGQGPRPRS